MQRLIAGAGLFALALSACGSRVAAGPPPHIVALGVPDTAVTELATATSPAPAAPVAPAPRASRSARRTPPAALPAGPVPDDVWGRLAQCESGGNPQAVGGRGRFYGAFQFTLRSWHSVGMGGSPLDYSYADQLAAAQRLQARSGWRNWPVCARRVSHA